MRNNYRTLIQVLIVAAMTVSGLSAATLNAASFVTGTEPGTLGMMLGGLGLLAFNAFRKRLARGEAGQAKRSGEESDGTSLNAMWD